MSVELGPIWITAVQQISSWIASNDIPNWATLIAELVFGGIITTIVYRLQSKTSKLSREVVEKIVVATRKIDSYVEEKKNLEEGRKKYFLDAITKDLEYIKNQYEQLANIINKFKETGQNPGQDTKVWITMQYHQIKWRCDYIENYIHQVENNFSNPAPNERILLVLSILKSPFESLMNVLVWQRGASVFQEVDMLLVTHSENVSDYLDFLSKETQT